MGWITLLPTIVVAIATVVLVVVNIRHLKRADSELGILKQQRDLPITPVVALRIEHTPLVRIEESIPWDKIPGKRVEEEFLKLFVENASLNAIMLDKVSVDIEYSDERKEIFAHSSTNEVLPAGATKDLSLTAVVIDYFRSKGKIRPFSSGNNVGLVNKITSDLSYPTEDLGFFLIVKVRCVSCFDRTLKREELAKHEIFWLSESAGRWLSGSTSERVYE